MKRRTVAILVGALLALNTASESTAAEPFSTRSRGPVQQSPSTAPTAPTTPPYVKPEAPMPQGPVQRVSPTAPIQQINPVERIQVTESTKLEDLLAKPDATIVVSADGKQSTTVGDLRRQVDARQRGIADIQSGKSLTGGMAKVRFPQGAKAVSLLQQSGMMLETTPVESARSKQGTSKAVSGVQESVRSRDLLTPQPGIHSVN